MSEAGCHYGKRKQKLLIEGQHIYLSTRLMTGFSYFRRFKHND